MSRLMSGVGAFLLDAVQVLAMVGFFALVISAAAFGGDSIVTYVVAAITIGPFLVGALVFLTVAYAELLAESWKRNRT